MKQGQSNQIKNTFNNLHVLEKTIKDYINWYNSDRFCKKLNASLKVIWGTFLKFC